MERRDRFTAGLEKGRAVREADAAGQIADSMEARMSIVNRIHSGEITLEEGQQELARIKRNANKNGKLTRAQVWSQS